MYGMAKNVFKNSFLSCQTSLVNGNKVYIFNCSQYQKCFQLHKCLTSYTTRSTLGIKRNQENDKSKKPTKLKAGWFLPFPSIILPQHSLCNCHLELEKPQAYIPARSVKDQLKYPKKSQSPRLPGNVLRYKAVKRAMTNIFIIPCMCSFVKY